ncbi:hypothetical protein OZN62_03110 [Aurantiacibacter sp. MUD11]|uniref:hypothetical protein n=1 Tax=Aurantiacibacter sp. MUD11 TaxID=3003265 RepID=UPI0022AA72CD|nr:hypothetical protein [Aurantiacibacter sp. MUD11]WAT18585.1 hypothetical protein OZN62_03110 [Aurantiacibacter sp. MUD11]
MKATFEFDELLAKMIELAQRSLVSLAPLFVVLTAVGLGVDYYLSDSTFAGLFLTIFQFVLSYFFVKKLAEVVGFIEEGEIGPGFGAYFGLSFVMGLGTGIGFLLLVLPGMYLTIRWILAYPMLFAPRESGGNPAEPLRASWQATGPVFWKLAVAYLFSLVALALTFYIYWDPGFDELLRPQLIPLAIANVLSSAVLIYNIILGFAAFLLVSGDIHETVEVFQ